MPTIEPEITPSVAPTGTDAIKIKAIGALPQITFTIVGGITGFFIAAPIIVPFGFALGFPVLVVAIIAIGVLLGLWYTKLARHRGLVLAGALCGLGLICSIAWAWAISAIIAGIISR